MTFVRRVFRNIFRIKPRRNYPVTFLESLVTTSDKKCEKCPYNLDCGSSPTSDCQYDYEERNFTLHNHNIFN